MKLKSPIFVFCLMMFTDPSQASTVPAPIKNFELDKYLGTWYEIARIENSFEKGLTNVTASYSLRKDGKVKVVNKGFEKKDNEWDEASGYAEFFATPDIGHLEVTFFWPFFADYVVFEVDKDYQYAFVTSDSKDYLWLLARTPKVDDKLIERFLEQAKLLEFNLKDLIFVSQERNIEQMPKSLSQNGSSDNDLREYRSAP